MTDNYTPPSNDPYGGPPPAPHPYPEYAPAITPPGKGLAIAALVLGVISLLFSWIPFLNLFTGIAAVVGLILGIVAIVKAVKGTTGGKVMAIVGTSLAALALILGTLVNTAFVSSLEDSTTSTSTTPAAVEEPEETPEAITEEPAENATQPSPEPVEEEVAPESDPGIPDGTRADPLLPVEHAVTFFDDTGDQWEVTVDTIVSDGWSEIQAENQFNEPPSDGNVYVILPVHAHRLGVTGSSPYFDLSFAFVGPSGQSYIEAPVVLPNDLMHVADMYEGAVASGNIAFEVPADDINGGVISVNYGWGLDQMFFEAISE